MEWDKFEILDEEEMTLLSASQLGLIDNVIYLIKQGADVNQEDRFKETPLVLALRFHHIEIVKYLIDSGANVNAIDRYGSTTLITALRKGHPELVPILIEKGVDTRVTIRGGITALILACRMGNLEVIRSLTNHDPRSVKVPDDFGNTPLMLCAQEGFTQAVKLLISKGADVNASNRYYNTPLMAAVQSGNLYTTLELMQQGAWVNKTGMNGNTPLNLAATLGFSSIVQCLVENGADMNLAEGYFSNVPLASAIRNSHRRIAEFLIDAECNVNLRNFEGDTPLILAVRKQDIHMVKYLMEKTKKRINKHGINGKGFTALIAAIRCDTPSIELLKYLVEQGLDVNVGSSCGDTALITAIRYGHVEVTRYLLEQGADIFKRNKIGRTPLMEAANFTDLELINLLIDKGCEVNANDNTIGDTALTIALLASDNLAVVKTFVERGCDVNLPRVGDLSTPLMVAVEYGRLEVVKFLVSAGSDVNHINREGDNSVIYAARSGHLPIVEFLLSVGGDPHVVDEYGDNALILASINDHLDMVKYLLDKGCDFMQRNEFGDTVLITAARNGHLETIKYLIEKKLDYYVKCITGRVDVCAARELAMQYGHVEIAEFLAPYQKQKVEFEKSSRSNVIEVILG